MNYKVYENLFDDEFVNMLLDYSNNNTYLDGKVGNRVDTKQKIRKDLFISNNYLLKQIDNKIYDNIYDDVLKNFNINIKFREKWKFGLYKSEEKGFYQAHRDDILTTKYRKLSMTIALSDPDSYDGGYFNFPELNKSFKLKKGSAIIFKSSILHEVKEVTKGERCILASFMFDSEGKKIKDEINPVNIKNFIPILDNVKINYTEDDFNDSVDANAVKYITDQERGDIDYSDNHFNEWTNKDDYYFEDNDSDILLVTFAGMGWKNSIPTFIFHNFLKEYKNIDKLFLRDIKCRYYIQGLFNSAINLRETIDLIKKLTTVKKYKKIVAIGTSAGGYASILFGHLLGFDKVVAFAPQVVINKNKDLLIEDKCNAPQTCKWLSSLNIEDDFYQSCLDLKNFLPLNTKVDIHYAKDANNGADKKHALYLESKNCKLIEHEGKQHMIALELRNNAKLKIIIDELIKYF